MKKNYLFVLNHPSQDAATNAIEATLKLNLRVNGQLGIYAIEVRATQQEAEGLFSQGMFAKMTCRKVNAEFLKEVDKKYASIYNTWNARFSKDYLEAKKERNRPCKAWQSEKTVEPAPYTKYDTQKVLDLLKGKLKEKNIKQGKPAIQIDTTKLTPKEWVKAAEFFRERVKDEKLAHEIGIIFFRADKAMRVWFLDPEILRLIVEILLHQALGDEPACLKMHGRNSIGIVFVESSKRGGPKFSTATRNAIENEIRSGLSFLVSEHPSGNIVWVTDVQRVTIDVDNKANAATVDSSFDTYWRHPAMGLVSFDGHTFTADSAGIDDYRDAMRAHHGSQHATVVFVSAFGTSWHGYSVGRRFISLSEHGNDWGGWGQNHLSTTTAHEICHQYGAADEYTGSGTPCSSCWGEHGCDNIPNGNCEACAKPAQDCIMNGASDRICNYTRAQIGWADIFVELFTDTDWFSGTDDDVRLDIGFRTFNLDTPNHNDRENGNREGYAIWAGGNLQRSEIKRILIRKSSDGFAGGWNLQRVRVMHQGDVICDEAPDVWLEGRKTWHLTKVFDDTIVNKLKIRVSTADEWWAGTDDDVTLRLAARDWNLDTDANDFERNESSTFELDPKTGIRVSDLTTITIKKSPDGISGGWKLKGLKLTVNGSEIYDNQSINTWLEDDDRIFSDNI